ncbi:MAG: J domain-containing protein [Deltaproteobacteria bacterium]|nr:J domain-containing protein [Deltaproteobacteria bacterium]MBW2015969.1 J domain-containing protein [Deltaproteobacteria bacterium]MBW2130872.1 J domain-containing protein [Deltaproteobacteria bacterium]MBW2302753.1 J domain-containing protein [Deltaproteobacteria bacterium]
MKLFEKITAARDILELPERATRKQIKANYRRLLREWHPDRGTRADKEIRERRTRQIIEAYRIIRTYCDNYRYSFTEEEVRNYLSGEEWWMERFGTTTPGGKSNP